ncbi:Gfo/Idh/MocA family oxidoreductase [Roseibium salinum]|uniref:Inositol 2-dehydrogenase n=1 Tax=Roseibium salinum TaxID=1604349 RepID=A0ABT3QW95_9HYPH|nr:Gfo/Idh/MocA family oxidoreductase [Roseibium sp. DSM 29163]MCX2721199.1 Gfo/Idh/MocA family oxidoreductase [Roseibium sp. DSM 29163]
MSLRIGVIGTGMIGQDHIRRITHVLPNCEVTAVTDVDRARAESAAAMTPNAAVYDAAAPLIAADNVDAVLIASWGPAHEEAILPALDAGKPIFCEKPLATTQDACLRIIDAEVATGRRLIQVGFMRRYDAAYKALKATVDSGEIGAPLLFHSVHRNASVPKGLYTSDMAVSDTMVHDIDVSRWLLDDEVARVRVTAAKPNSLGEDLRDPIFAVMEMRGGALATVEVSVNIGYGYDIRGEISAEKGAASLGESNPILVKTSEKFSGRVPADWRERFIAAYDAEIAEWVIAASKGGATGPSAWDGYAITAVSDAALKAANTGEAADVTLVDRPALYGN